MGLAYRKMKIPPCFWHDPRFGTKCKVEQNNPKLKDDINWSISIYNQRLSLRREFKW